VQHDAGILAAYQKGVARLAETQGIDRLGAGPTAESRAGAVLFGTDAETFARTPHLAEEVFGAAGLLVRHTGWEALAPLLRDLEGQLTITIHMTAEDEPIAAQLLPVLETKAGRILVNGWPTGVEVSHAMVHGGPFPATSDARTTSVGTLAIRRFLRPVCYQNLSPALLPEAVADANPWGLWRRLDGTMTPPRA
jgi:alpha-ketoglutaric semialdehyde dehydrogenase